VPPFSKLSRARFGAHNRREEETPQFPDSSMPMLEALVCEVHSAALLTATIASAINAFKRAESTRSDTDLKPYVPGEPAIVSVLRNGMLETDLNEDTTIWRRRASRSTATSPMPTTSASIAPPRCTSSGFRMRGAERARTLYSRCASCTRICSSSRRNTRAIQSC
jgi:hypothetical protein